MICIFKNRSTKMQYESIASFLLNLKSSSKWNITALDDSWKCVYSIYLSIATFCCRSYKHKLYRMILKFAVENVSDLHALPFLLQFQNLCYRGCSNSSLILSILELYTPLPSKQIYYLMQFFGVWKLCTFKQNQYMRRKKLNKLAYCKLDSVSL